MCQNLKKDKLYKKSLQSELNAEKVLEIVPEPKKSF
jgi:hypothetical protein